MPPLQHRHLSSPLVDLLRQWKNGTENTWYFWVWRNTRSTSLLCGIAQHCHIGGQNKVLRQVYTLVEWLIFSSPEAKQSSGKVKKRWVLLGRGALKWTCCFASHWQSTGSHESASAGCFYGRGPVQENRTCEYGLLCHPGLDPQPTLILKVMFNEKTWECHYWLLLLNMLVAFLSSDPLSFNTESLTQDKYEEKDLWVFSKAPDFQTWCGSFIQNTTRQLAFSDQWGGS